MDLREKIIEKRNKFWEEIKQIEKDGSPLFIYGAGEGGENVSARLLGRGVEYDGIVVDAAYWKDENEILCLENVLQNTDKKISLIVAHRGFDEEKLIPYMDKIDRIVDRDCFMGNYAVDPHFITYEWVMQNSIHLQSVLDRLCDSRSKDTMLAYLNQKISLDYKYLKKTRAECQYFDDDIINLSEGELLIDCGAYDGDTAVSFIEALKRKGISTYNEIVSFEPDRINYEKLCERKLPRHTCLCKGVSDQVQRLSFEEKGTSGRIVENGEDNLEVDTIDSLVSEKPVTLIKMDIEGYELAALKGARDTIIKWQPRLAICIYHKREDLWEIADYIQELVPSYKLYMRNYEESATELVLYAI